MTANNNRIAIVGRNNPGVLFGGHSRPIGDRRANTLALSILGLQRPKGFRPWSTNRGAATVPGKFFWDQSDPSQIPAARLLAEPIATLSWPPLSETLSATYFGQCGLIGGLVALRINYNGITLFATEFGS
jgi:hypothetical protein